MASVEELEKRIKALEDWRKTQVDASGTSALHTLGLGHNQAARGDHTHET